MPTYKTFMWLKPGLTFLLAPFLPSSFLLNHLGIEWGRGGMKIWGIFSTQPTIEG